MPWRIVRNDIAEMHCDAIVNAANSSLKMGGGVCGAIFKKAGAEQLRKECDAIGWCPPGKAVITSGCGLNARYVIHAVGPRYQDGNSGESALLRGAYRSALDLAAEYQCESIAFPLISAGIYGYPRREAMDIAIEVFREFLLDHELEIIFVLYGRDSVEEGKKRFPELQSFIDDRYVDLRPRRREYEAGLASNRPENQYDLGCGLPEEREDRPACAPAPAKAEAAKPAKKQRKKTFGTELFEKKQKEKADSSAADLTEPVPLACPAEPHDPVSHSIKEADGLSLEEVLKRAQLKSFHVLLTELMQRRSLENKDVYAAANLDRKHFSKIINGTITPGKRTVLALAVAMRLTLDETVDFLSHAGYALNPGDKFDIILQYFISIGNYDIFDINEQLFVYDQQQLGAS